ncbi:MAG TPA: hypothetical protein GX506_10455 [Firmicutes bacterium]|nr:hypothetical protein [Bacillota bacterium]
MTLAEVRDILEAEVLTGEENLDDIEVPRGCGCDLMSDVLAFAERRTLLLTGLTNAQVIRTAEMNDLAAIVFVRGKRPPCEVIEMAKERGIPLLRTKYPLFESCGMLYKAGLRGHLK